MGLGRPHTSARCVGVVWLGIASCMPANAEARDRSMHANDMIHVGYAQGLRPGVQLGFRRAIARHVTLGLELEHAFQRVGLWQLPAVMTAARAEIWPMGALHRMFVAAVFGVHAHVFAYERSMHAIAVAPGIEVGWAFTLPHGVMLGLAGGMRAVVQVHRAPAFCVGRDACPQVRTGMHPRAVAMIGYRF